MGCVADGCLSSYSGQVRRIERRDSGYNQAKGRLWLEFFFSSSCTPCVMIPKTRYRHSSNLISMWNLSFTQVSALSDPFRDFYLPIRPPWPRSVTNMLLIGKLIYLVSPCLPCMRIPWTNGRTERVHLPASITSIAYNFAGVWGCIACWEVVTWTLMASTSWFHSDLVDPN